jgi:hypothetical protein
VDPGRSPADDAPFVRRGVSRLTSADDPQGEMGRAATLHQPGNLMPANAVGI